MHLNRRFTLEFRLSSGLSKSHAFPLADSQAMQM